MKKLIYLGIVIVLGFVIFTRMSRRASSKAVDVLIVGTSADFQPMSFKKENDIVGFDIDLITEIGKRLNKKIEIKDMPFEVLLPQIQLGSIHVIAAGMSATPERMLRVLFSEPYISNNPLVTVTRIGEGKVTNFDQLKGKRVIVNQGYVADIELSKMPEIQLVRLATVADALMALDAHRGDVFVTAASSIKPVIEALHEARYETHPLPGTEENTALAISKEHSELQTSINRVLNELETDGTLHTLKEKWHLE